MLFAPPCHHKLFSTSALLEIADNESTTEWCCESSAARETCYTRSIQWSEARRVGKSSKCNHIHVCLPSSQRQKPAFISRPRFLRALLRRRWHRRQAKLEVAITAGTFLILIYMKIDLFRNVSDFRNLFRDGQSPHCILQITASLYTTCIYHILQSQPYQCAVSKFY